MKLKRLAVYATALSALTLCASSAQAANLLVNGDFESTDNGYSETETPVGWTNIGHFDGVIAYSAFDTPAYDGSYFYDEGGYGDAENAPGDGIEQSVATTPGATYLLTFGLSSENVSGAEIADVTIGSSTTQYTLGVDSSYGELAAPFVTYSIDYTATSALTEIAFTTDAASPSLGNNDPMIDGISFTPTISAAPEPSVWALMIAGVGVMGAALRFGRRREDGVATVG